jgi:hypothetical protein
MLMLRCVQGSADKVVSLRGSVVLFEPCPPFRQMTILRKQRMLIIRSLRIQSEVLEQSSSDRLSDLVVRVLGYRSRFPSLSDFLRSSGSGTGSTQPREYN